MIKYAKFILPYYLHIGLEFPKKHFLGFCPGLSNQPKQCPLNMCVNLIKFLFVCLAAQSCPTLCGPMNCSLPVSSAHGIFQARILEWVAISSSRVSSQARSQTHISCISCIGRLILYHWHHLNIYANVNPTNATRGP